MAKDLIRRTEIVPNAQEDALKGQARTEVDEAASALMKRMLFGAEPQSSVPDHPRIILAVDATSSMGEYLLARKLTLEAASDLAAGLFAKAGSAGLQVKLAYFRGDDQFPKQPRQLCFSKKWYGNAEELARAIAGIEHQPGWTQHCRLLREVIEEVQKCAVQELIIFSDAFEQRTPLRPQSDDLQAARVHAKRLRDLGVTLSFGFGGIIRGGCPLDRAGVNAKEAFHNIAEANGGAVFLFDPAQLNQRFSEIAERAMRVVKGDAIGAQLLLEYLRTIEFDFVVGEQVHAKCGAEGE